MTLTVLKPEMKSQGVIFCEMAEALSQHAAVVNAALKDVPEELKGRWDGARGRGTFIFVPRNVEVKDTLHVRDSLNSLTLIVMEPGSQLTVIDDMGPWPSNSHGFRYAVIKEDARLYYVQIQRGSEEINHDECQYSTLQQNARLTSVNVGLGGYHTETHLQTVLEGKGSDAKLLGIFLGHGKQQFNIYTTQHHKAGESRSDLLFKSALKDEAKSNYEGVIQIPKTAQKSDAYQANRNLLLSPDAKARTVPKLEIIADDVRCTHAATVGTIDETETFYLQARGISFEDAQTMIVQGFFEQVVSQIPSEEIRTELSQVIEKKLRGY